MNRFANPNLIFVVLWGCLIALQSLEITNNYVRSSPVVLVIIGMNIFLAFFLQLTMIHHRKVADIRQKYRELISSRLPSIERAIKFFLTIYIFISVLDVVYSGGFPLYWIVSGSEKLYVDFGIPTVHGLANGIVFFLFTLLVLLDVLGIKRKRGLLFLLLLWQVCILGRGVIMVMGVQSLCVVMLLSRSGILSMWKYAILAIFVIIGFGYFGDLRQTYNPFIPLVNDEWRSFFENIPSGFLWVYIYFTSGYNNLIFNVDLINPTYFPYYSLAKLVPSVVYNLLGVTKTLDGFEFVNENLNVSTIYASFYSDFGILAFFPVFFIQGLAVYFYKRAWRGDFFSLLKYSIVFQAIIFSPFIDTFFYLPFIVQFLFIKYLKYKTG